MTIRKMFPVLFVAMFAVGYAPAEVAGQISSCAICEKSDFQPGNGSTICVGSYSGRKHCAQQGDADFHLCLAYGESCWDDVFAAADEMAVESLRKGKMLPIEGDHLILTEGDDILVMRKCGAVIARFAMSELQDADEHAGLLASGPTQGSEHADILVAATEPRRRVLRG